MILQMYLLKNKFYYFSFPLTRCGIQVLQEVSEMVKPKHDEFERKFENQNQKVKTIADCLEDVFHVLKEEIRPPKSYQNPVSVSVSARN